MFKKIDGVNKSRFIIMNWKMNIISSEEADGIFKLIAELSKKTPNSEIIVCPPFPYLLRHNFKTSDFKLGAQNCFWENKGAYTGEISPLMLKKEGVLCVIIGHSERRLYLNETDEMINKKIIVSLKAGLKTVFCVGERKRDEKFDYFLFLKEQLDKGLKDLPLKFLKNLLIAYEPIWAISSEENAEPETAEDLLTISIFIRKVLFDLFNTKKIFDIPILYGGSVTHDNIKSFLDTEGISGVLIGGASVNKKELKNMFLKLC